jgi:hypothetical protein
MFGLVEIFRFFADIGSNCPVAIFFVPFWCVKVILAEESEMLLHIRWRIMCHASSKSFFSFAAREANLFLDLQWQSLEIFWQTVRLIREQTPSFSWRHSSLCRK